MNIQEAVRKARDQGGAIYRTSDEIPFYMLATNSALDCLLYVKDGKQAYARWNPSMDDLLADDWEVSCKFPACCHKPGSPDVT